MKPRSLGTSAVAVKESLTEREAAHKRMQKSTEEEEKTRCKVTEMCPLKK